MDPRDQAVVEVRWLELPYMQLPELHAIDEVYDTWTTSVDHKLEDADIAIGRTYYSL